MHRIVRRTLIGGGLAVAFCALASCSSGPKSVMFTDAQGTVRTLTDYKGSVLVIGFANTWCDPCQEAGLQMQALQERFGSQGVKVLSVSAWERGDPRKWMAEHGYNYGVMLNGTDIARQYDVDKMPTFVVLGVDGKVIYRHDGFDRSAPDKIASAIEKHMRKMGNSFAGANG